MFKFISNMYILGKLTEEDLQTYVDKKIITSEQVEEIKGLKVSTSENTTEDTSDITLNLNSLSW